MRAALTLSLACLLVGCAEMEPFEPPVAGEMNPEPGLFSGPSGEFVLFRRVLDEPSTDTPVEPAPRRLTDPPPP